MTVAHASLLVFISIRHQLSCLSLLIAPSSLMALRIKTQIALASHPTVARTPTISFLLPLERRVFSYSTLFMAMAALIDPRPTDRPLVDDLFSSLWCVTARCLALGRRGVSKEAENNTNVNLLLMLITFTFERFLWPTDNRLFYSSLFYILLFCRYHIFFWLTKPNQNETGGICSRRSVEGM